jgi:large subunit ribosomal protein L25
MNNPTIHAELRTTSGKGVARKLRAAQRMPAVAYGGNGGTVSLTIDPSELETLRAGPLGWNQPVQIEVDGGERVALALLKAVDKHPVSGQLLHADFVRLEPGAPISVNVPLRVQGVALGIAMGGLLNHQVRLLRVRCLPKDIPPAIGVDVSAMDVGDRLLLSELRLPAGVTAAIEDQPVVSVVGRRGGGLDDEEEAEGAEDGAADGEAGAADGESGAKESGE